MYNLLKLKQITWKEKSQFPKIKTQSSVKKKEKTQTRSRKTAHRWDYSLTRRVRERVHFWARPTMEKGSQWVGIKECNNETVAIPPMVDRSSALIPPSISLCFLPSVFKNFATYFSFFFKEFLFFFVFFPRFQVLWSNTVETITWIRDFLFLYSCTSVGIFSKREKTWCAKRKYGKLGYEGNFFRQLYNFSQ